MSDLLLHRGDQSYKLLSGMQCKNISDVECHVTETIMSGLRLTKSGQLKRFLFFFSLRGVVCVGTVPILALHLLAPLNIYSFHGKQKPCHQDLLK